MLEEHEWQLVAPHLSNTIEQVKQHRQEHGVTLAEARAQGFGQEALRLYESLTGFRESNVDAIWHHRVSLYGEPCANCGKPLRTPTATFCAECGASAA